MIQIRNSFFNCLVNFIFYYGLSCVIMTYGDKTCFFFLYKFLSTNYNLYIEITITLQQSFDWKIHEKKITSYVSLTATEEEILLANKKIF
jgi:hypothetical protein